MEKNYSKKNRGRKPNYKKGYINKKQYPRDKNEEEIKASTNDPSWYSKYPQLVQDTSTLWFSNPVGSKINRLNYPLAGVSREPGLSHTPGIISINAIAVPGYSRDTNSPVNAIARGIYSFIRHANSGHANYEAPDLMMYLLAIDTCYSFWASCVRAYGTARIYNVRSRYMAIQYLKAMGFSSSILNNLAQFRAEINNFAVKLSSYAVPSSMDFFRRHTDMYTRVYLDEPSPKAQAYLFRLAKYYKFYNDASDGGKLILDDFPSDQMSLTDIRTVMTNLINPIISDEDMNIMSGDILKAYGEGGIFKIPMIPEEYTTEFGFDATVLGQIENSMSVPTLESTSLGVTQDPLTSSIIFCPQISNANDYRLMPRKILNLHTDTPTAMDVMEASRLMYNIAYDSDLQQSYVTGFGAELILSYTLHYFVNGTFANTVFNTINPWTHTLSAYDLGPSLALISNIADFNYHPRYIGYTSDGNDWTMAADLMDLDNFTEVDDNVLENVSNTAMLSLFDVGHIALG